MNFVQICVVGSQSDGKSTLLSAVASSSMPGDLKFEFLPTETGICTRVPIIVQMLKVGARHEARVYSKRGASKVRALPRGSPAAPIPFARATLHGCVRRRSVPVCRVGRAVT